MRKCRTCDYSGSIDSFPKAGTVKGIVYYRHLCKSCYANNKRKRDRHIRKQFFDLKKTFKCSHCGNDDYRVLEFHHLKDKSFNVSEGPSAGKSIESIKKEIEKCQVLCANCHRVKTWEERNFGI